MSLGDWFSGSSRKGGTGGGELGIYTQKVKTAWLYLDLAVKKNPSVDHFTYFKCKWSYKTINLPHRASMQCLSLIY